MLQGEVDGECQMAPRLGKIDLKSQLSVEVRLLMTFGRVLVAGWGRMFL